VVGAVGVGSVWPQLAVASAATMAMTHGERFALICFINMTVS
jgi:hypothetical protein